MELDRIRHPQDPLDPQLFSKVNRPHCDLPAEADQKLRRPEQDPIHLGQDKPDGAVRPGVELQARRMNEILAPLYYL